MRFTVLMDNRPDPRHPRLRAEHGLSILVESGGARVLFDSGASTRFIGNAQALGVELEAIDAVVLSHGHYDHGGGLAAFLGINGRAKVTTDPAPSISRQQGPCRRGLHMMNPLTGRLSEREEAVRAVGAALDGDRAVKRLYAGHCTGEAALEILGREMGGKLSPLMVGLVAEA